jgi:hypothetical protein
MANNWNDAEIAAIVADYFAMLQMALKSQKYNKSEHRRALRDRLNKRTDAAVERKHQNISAVLIQLGVPYIAGYKPLGNYQKALGAAVTDYLVQYAEIHRLFAAHSLLVPPEPEVEDFLDAWCTPPEPRVHEPTAKEQRTRYGFKPVDYLAGEARNQLLGEAGEKFVLNFERARLIRVGKEALADRIEQVSVTVGPSAGFDIKSYDEDGSDRFIEAKTTKYGKYTPFYVTPHELQFSSNNAERYCLYRLYQFGESTRLFGLRGRVENSCTLAPSEYKARPAW